jgi:hypothetical protein
LEPILCRTLFASAKAKLGDCIRMRDPGISGITLPYLKQFHMAIEVELMRNYVALEKIFLKEVIFSHSWMVYIDQFVKDVQKAFKVGELMYMNPDSYEVIKELTIIQTRIKNWNTEFFNVKSDQQDLLLNVSDLFI